MFTSTAKGDLFFRDLRWGGMGLGQAGVLQRWKGRWRLPGRGPEIKKKKESA